MSIEYETGLQNFVYQVDSGTGRKAIHVAIFILFAIAVAALYTYFNFQGLRDARAMEEAQLARNLSQGEGLNTRCIRPLSLWKMMETHDGDARLQGHPDLFHPPVWPALLSFPLRLAGVPTGKEVASSVMMRDYLPVVFSHLFAILSVVWVWLIARKLFDARTGTYSATAYLLCDMVWRRSVAGDDYSAALFFLLGAAYFALRAVDPVRDGRSLPAETPLRFLQWFPALAVSALLTATAFLTRYAAGVIALCLFLYIGCARHRAHSWRHAFLYLLMALLPVGFWAWRNCTLCGLPFGLVFHQMLSDTYLFPGDALVRSISPSLPEAGTLLYAVQLKWMDNFRQLISTGMGLGATGLLPALFAAVFLHRFVRPASRILRWCILPAALLGIVISAAFSGDAPVVLALLWPLAIPYAWAFFLVLADRIQFEYRIFAALAVWLVMFLSAFPFLLNIVPPRTGLPYPPYYHAYVAWVCGMVEPGETLSTDIPWATSWYGGTPSILLPRDMEDYYQITRTCCPVPLIYFTTLTRDKPWVRGLSDPVAPEYSWYRAFSSGNVPSDFPLIYGRHIAGSDQMVLSARPVFE